MACIEGNGVSTEAQHGFRTKKSTETPLQIFIKSKQEATEKKEPNWNFFYIVQKPMMY
jgi:hypothetical protein